MMPAPVRKGLSLGDLLAGIVPLEHHLAAMDVSGLSMDSRGMRPGDLFLACAGHSTHGARFLAAAFRAGAAAALLETNSPQLDLASFPGPVIPVPDLGKKADLLAHRFFGQPSRDLTVIGVTGTNGKTSVSHFIAQALNESPGAGPCGLIGTLGHGSVGRLTAQNMTTPDPISVHRLLAGLLQQGVRSVAMEVSSHALAQARVDSVAFHTAVFTNLSRDHLDYHGDMRRYGEAKMELFRCPGLRNAVINLDDPFSPQVIAVLAGEVSLIGYTLGPGDGKSGKTLHGRLLQASTRGIQVQVVFGAAQGIIQSPLLGRVNAQNLLAAMGALLATGVAFTQAVEALSRASAVPGRLEVFRAGAGLATVIVDYAHTPHALQEVLSALRALCPGRLWCVFGCGGNRDPGKRSEMGTIAARLADLIVLTDDNPRFEDPDAIIGAILTGIADKTRVRVLRDRALAIRGAIAGAGADDTVLIAGKGHEPYQELAGTRHPFSDRELVSELLTEAGA
ncbi:MAG: UDP-N-acetylmuramoyl-L-alanyl-D-glutamate--2,6-diaminopimelate ligase [Gammaproteobacteria bacterium]